MRDLGEHLKLRIPGAARSSSGGTDGESSPLLNLSTEAQQPPQSEVRESSSELSFSHEVCITLVLILLLVL